MERKTELDARLIRFCGNISERRIFSIKWQKSTHKRQSPCLAFNERYTGQAADAQPSTGV